MLPSQVNINLAENNDVPDLGRRGKRKLKARHLTQNADGDDDNDDDRALEKLLMQPDAAASGTSPNSPNSSNTNNYLSPTSSSFINYIDDDQETEIDDEDPAEADDSKSLLRNSNRENSTTTNNSNIVIVDDVPLRQLQPQTQVAPVFIDHENRQFLNPISYIGGPRLGVPTTGASQPTHSNSVRSNNVENRKSIDSITSILSID